MVVEHIIQDGLIKFDQSHEKLKLLNEYTTEIIANHNDDIRTKIIFRNKITNEKMLETDVEYLAYYYPLYKTWAWAWADSNLSHSEKYLSKQLLLWALDRSAEYLYIRSNLITSRTILQNEIQIDINIALAIEILKKPYIYKFDYQVGTDILTVYFILIDSKSIEKLT